MSIHQTPPTEWAPLTDKHVDHLHAKYCTWIEDLTEIRERMDGLRDLHRLGWTPPAELQERLDDLHERDELYAAKYMPTARAFLDAAERDIDATQTARMQRLAQLLNALACLRHAWENGWQEMETWTREERSEIIWLIYCNPELKNLYRIAEQNTLYFWGKLVRLYHKCEAKRTHEATRYALGMVPRLGIKKFGKQLGKARR